MATHPMGAPAFAHGPLWDALADRWQLVLLRGIISILFGAAALVWPGLTLLALVLLYGAYAIVDGALAFAAAFTKRAGMGRFWWLILAGLAGLAAGIIAFAWPGITSLALVLLIGAWAVVHGVFEIVGAIRLRREIDNEWFLIFAGVISVLFGLSLLIFPGAGALALIWVIALYAIAFGIALVFFAFRLRSRGKQAA